LIQVRSVTDTELEVEEHGLLVPLPGPDPDSIVFEARDGQSIQEFYAKSIEAHTDGEKKPFIKASDLRLRLFITDARFAFACSKYDKGGGWIGGPTALAMNAGSKLLAAQRRKGKMFVGHLRYPWISDVFARNKDGWSSEETLRIIVKLPGDESWTRIDFQLPKDSSATARASEIVRRAAAFRLGCEPDLDEDERTQFAAYADLDDLAWRKGDSLVGVTFRSSWPVGEKSALIGPSGGTARQAAPQLAGANGPARRGDDSEADALSRMLTGSSKVTDAPPAQGASHTVAPAVVADLAGNVVSPSSNEGPGTSPKTTSCDSCRSALAPGDRFCGRCGSPAGGL
jgi:hypothetical protein